MQKRLLRDIVCAPHHRAPIGVNRATTRHMLDGQGLSAALMRQTAGDIAGDASRRRCRFARSSQAYQRGKRQHDAHHSRLADEIMPLHGR